MCRATQCGGSGGERGGKGGGVDCYDGVGCGCDGREERGVLRGTG